MVICNRYKYQAYLRAREGILASQQTMTTGANESAKSNSSASIIFNQSELKIYCLRQLDQNELSSKVKLTGGSIMDDGGSTTTKDYKLSNYYVGLHVIVPIDWSFNGLNSVKSDHVDIVYLSRFLIN